MERWMAAVCALALSGPLAAVQAGEPKRVPVAVPSHHDARLASLSPSLRDWVAAQARATLESPAPIDEFRIARTARARLAGQAFSDADIEALVMLVMAQAARDAEADLHAAMERMRAARQGRQAIREQAAMVKQQEQGLSSTARAEYGKATQQKPQPQPQPNCGDKPCLAVVLPASPRATLAVPAGPGTAAPGKPADSMSAMGEQSQQQLQLYQDRYAKATAALSNVMKKYGSTASNITSNLK